MIKQYNEKLKILREDGINFWNAKWEELKREKEDYLDALEQCDWKDNPEQKQHIRKLVEGMYNRLFERIEDAKKDLL